MTLTVSANNLELLERICAPNSTSMSDAPLFAEPVLGTKLSTTVQITTNAGLVLYGKPGDIVVMTGPTSSSLFVIDPNVLPLWDIRPYNSKLHQQVVRKLIAPISSRLQLDPDAVAEEIGYLLPKESVGLWRDDVQTDRWVEPDYVMLSAPRIWQSEYLIVGTVAVEACLSVPTINPRVFHQMPASPGDVIVRYRPFDPKTTRVIPFRNFRLGGDLPDYQHPYLID